MRLRALLVAALTFLPALASQAGKLLLPLSDGAGGVTCQYHLAGVRAEWERRGGDWSDASGKPYGDRPLATATIDRAAAPQLVEWDVTELAREWAEGNQPVGAIFLRTVRGGSARFLSREHADAQVRPVLEVEWSGGAHARLAPSADTSVNCTTVKSLGRSGTITASGDSGIVIVFPFDGGGGQIRRARLQLTSDNQRGKAVEVGVFRLVPPWVKEAPVRRGIADSYPGDRNIAEHPAVFFADGFEASNWVKGWSIYSRASIAEAVASDANGFEPLQGKALRTTLRPDQNLGLDLRYDFAKLHGSEPEAAYFRYYLRFGDDWSPTRDGGKLPGFAGTYNRGGWGMRKSDGTNGWSARGAFFQNHPDDGEAEGFGGIGSYVYHVPKGTPSGGQVLGWGQGPTGRLRTNQWYCIEQQVKMNDPGQANGVLRAWVDGRLVFERTDMRFRNVHDLKIENVWFNVFHGGTAKPPREMSLYIDNVVIAREYIGPMSIPDR